MEHLKYDRREQSSVAQNIFENNRKIDTANLKLVSEEYKQQQTTESIELFKYNNVMNTDKEPIPYTFLYCLLKQHLFVGKLRSTIHDN